MCILYKMLKLKREVIFARISYNLSWKQHTQDRYENYKEFYTNIYKKIVCETFMKIWIQFFWKVGGNIGIIM